MKIIAKKKPVATTNKNPMSGNKKYERGERI